MVATELPLSPCRIVPTRTLTGTKGAVRTKFIRMRSFHENASHLTIRRRCDDCRVAGMWKHPRLAEHRRKHSSLSGCQSNCSPRRRRTWNTFPRWPLAYESRFLARFQSHKMTDRSSLPEMSVSPSGVKLTVLTQPYMQSCTVVSPQKCKGHAIIPKRRCPT